MAEEDRQLLFEHYKLAVEMADRVSARRGTANAFFLAANSGLLAAAESLSLPVVAIIGLIIAAAWFLLLRSYRILSSAKWTVIGQLEEELPAQPFRDEWSIVKRDPVKETLGRSKLLTRYADVASRYAELSIVEQVVPFMFVVLYAVSLGRAAG